MDFDFAAAADRIIRDVARSFLRSTRRKSTSTRRSTKRRSNKVGSRRRYPGDYRGYPNISYDPHPDQLADPGEIVWTWVPYKENHSRGKDRPVLIIGSDEQWLLAVMLSSKTHTPRKGRTPSWVSIGSGRWDPRRRKSEVRIDRIIRVSPADVRRIGARLPRAKFDKVVAGIRKARS
ncbi:MAG: growth inhibitor PemK [Propionibacterium sp.]|nr:MAG: growth inhibitor PemK [Propionibacterium sp.]